MTAVWTFLRHYLTESEAWLLLPVLAAACVAVASFFFLQSQIEQRSTVSDAEKADWRRQLIEQGKLVTERAKLKAEADAAATLANRQKKLQALNNSSSSQPDDEASTTPTDELRQRKGAKEQQQQPAADDSGMASDNDWELVDDERVERAEESEYEPPIEYQQAVEAFIETMQETPQTAVDELHTAVKKFFAVLCSLLDGSSHVTPLPSTSTAADQPNLLPPTSSSLSSSDRYATRNVLLARLVDTQSLHALHEVAVAHPGTPLGSDAEHLHQLLVPLLHSH